MFGDLLRDLKDRVLAPVAQTIGHNVSPLAISLIAFVAGLDGTLARLQGRSSDLGAYLDLLLDFAVYAARRGSSPCPQPAPGAWSPG